ncbi:HNH endonuclease [Clostridium sp. chh4-2]|uniref:HNH endonuclease n=1 Tax=Clostridium sp. chh4-2 TaxID=2067550 RepID=UPI000CCE7DEF|nr:HNH endonuclease signature motif containing protein [Clostridium sp. chh4-2]PNV62230.1 HNH endonuclease [Clostridium sp. chh4-2]
MRRKLTRAERQQVYEKCKGHCAYCGGILEYKDMQVDHVTPLRIGGTDEIQNMLPSCRSCNHYKSTLDVEGYRKYLAGIPHRLMRDNIPFQIGVRFGLVQHIKDDVTFYFETLNYHFQKEGRKYNDCKRSER